jgi:hypothetical protein
MTPREIATLQGIGNDTIQGFVAITNKTVLLSEIGRCWQLNTSLTKTFLAIYAVLVLKASFVLLYGACRRV